METRYIDAKFRHVLKLVKTYQITPRTTLFVVVVTSGDPNLTHIHLNPSSWLFFKQNVLRRISPRFLKQKIDFQICCRSIYYLSFDTKLVAISTSGNEIRCPEDTNVWVFFRNLSGLTVNISKIKKLTLRRFSMLVPPHS